MTKKNISKTRYSHIFSSPTYVSNSATSSDYLARENKSTNIHPELYVSKVVEESTIVEPTVITCTKVVER